MLKFFWDTSPVEMYTGYLKAVGHLTSSGSPTFFVTTKKNPRFLGDFIVNNKLRTLQLRDFVTNGLHRIQHIPIID